MNDLLLLLRRELRDVSIVGLLRGSPLDVVDTVFLSVVTHVGRSEWEKRRYSKVDKKTAGNEEKEKGEARYLY
jgi:hypothetical protein